MKEDAYTLFQRGKELLESGNPAQAAVVLERAKRLQPKKSSIRETLARAYYNYGEYSKSEKEFKKVLDIDPANHYAHFGLGLSFGKVGKEVLAFKHLKLACAMEPNSEDYQKALERLEEEKLRGERLREEIKVVAYASSRGEEVPRFFDFAKTRYEVREVVKSWREESLKKKERKTYFYVRTDKDKNFILSYSEESDTWLLEKLVK